jgi:hypothetical protein
MLLALAELAVKRERERGDEHRFDDGTDDSKRARIAADEAVQPSAIVREFLSTHGTYACPVCGVATPHRHDPGPTLSEVPEPLMEWVRTLMDACTQHCENGVLSTATQNLILSRVGPPPFQTSELPGTMTEWIRNAMGEAWQLGYDACGGDDVKPTETGYACASDLDFLLKPGRLSRPPVDRRLLEQVADAIVNAYAPHVSLTALAPAGLGSGAWRQALVTEVIDKHQRGQR